MVDVMQGHLFFEELIRTRFGREWHDLPAIIQDMPADEIERRMAGVREEYANVLRRLYGWQSGRNAATGVGIFRYLLARYGLPLKSRRVRIPAAELSSDGSFFRQVYTIDPDEWSAALTLAADSRPVNMSKKQAEACAKKIASQVLRSAHFECIEDKHSATDASLIRVQLEKLIEKIELEAAK